MQPYTQGPNFGPEKCVKDFTVTRWICFANAIVVQSLSFGPDSNHWKVDQYWNLINFLLFEIHSHVPNCNFGPLSNFSNTHFGSDSKSNPTRDTKTPSKTFLNKNWTQSYLFKPIRVYRFLQREQCNTVLSTHYR